MVSRWQREGEAWLASVEDELLEICARYGAEPLNVFEARYSFVVEVATERGALVLRSSPDPAGRFQAAAAQSLAQVGAGPKIYEIIDSPVGTWTVSERVTPGTTLGGYPFPLAAVGELLSRLVGAAPPMEEMPTLSEWLRGRLEDDELSDLAPGRDVAPKRHREHALELLADLGSGSGDGLCHGDASPGNLIIDRSGRPVFIDPRGVKGDAAYDVAVVALKTSSSAELGVRVAQLAKRAGVPLERVVPWVAIADAARV